MENPKELKAQENPDVSKKTFQKETEPDTQFRKRGSIFSRILRWMKQTKIFNKKTCKLLIILFCFLGITNPSLIPFLPYSIKMRLTYTLQYLFGDVTQVVKIIPMNWIIFFQLIVMLLLLSLLMELFKTILENVHSKNARMQTLITVFLSTAKYIFTLIGIIWALKIMGIHTGTVFASIGIASLIIGFSAESLIADVVTGLFLLFDNQYNVGDIIEIGEFRGNVIKIGIRTTSIEDAGGNIKIINNSDMRNIINRSRMKSAAVCDIAVPIGQDLLVLEKKLGQALEEITEKEQGLLLEAPKYLGVQSLDNNSMVIRIIALVEEKNIYHAQRLINHEIKVALQEKKVWG